MTDEQARIGKLEDKYHDVDKRQQSFEEFTRENLKSLRETMEDFKEAIKSTNERMDRLETNLTNQMHNLLVGGGIGVAAIIATMIGIVVALK